MASGVTWSNSMDGNNYATAMDKALKQAVTKAGIIIERQAVALAPTDSGRLKGSITWRTRSDGDGVRTPAKANDGVSKPSRKWTAHIGTNVEYAPHVEYGTDSHVVRAKRGKYLTFKVGGHWVKKESVKIPSIPAQPFLRPALSAKKRVIMRDFQKWVDIFLKRGK